MEIRKHGVIWRADYDQWTQEVNIVVNFHKVHLTEFLSFNLLIL